MPGGTRGSGKEAAIDLTRLVAGMARDGPVMDLSPSQRVGHGACNGRCRPPRGGGGPARPADRGLVGGQSIEVCAAGPLIVRGPRPIKGAQTRSPRPAETGGPQGGSPSQSVRDEIKPGSRTRGARARAPRERKSNRRARSRLPGLRQGWAKWKRRQAPGRVNCERRSCHGPFRVKNQAYGAMSGSSQEAALFSGTVGRRVVIVTRAHPERGVFFSG
jgi:hypothetical protein